MEKKSLKMNKKVMFFISLLSVFMFCVPIQQVFAESPKSDYELSFYDDFSESTLNTDTWFYRTGTAFDGVNLPKNIWLGLDDNGNSNLNIDFKYEDYNNDGKMDYTGGGIISRENFGYGYYEVRAKLYGETKGLHQSFWTMGTGYYTDIVGGNIPAKNQVLEIDCFEVDSATPNKLSTNTHDYIPTHVNNGSTDHSINTTEWFVAGFEWLPGRINYYINDVLVKTTEFEELYAPQNVWITALPTVTGFGGAIPPNDGAKMQVDYFKFYTRKVSGNLIANQDFELQYAVPNYQNPIGWIETGTKDASQSISSEAMTDAYSLKHDFSSTYSVETKQILNYVPNSTYKLMAFVKSSGGQKEANMTVNNFSGNNLSVPIPQTNEWTQISIDNIEVVDNKVEINFYSNASAGQWILVDNVVFEEETSLPLETIYIDFGDKGYSENGTWLTSSLKGYLESSTRYSNSTGASATWTPNIGVAGEYEVFIYKVVNSSSDPNAKIDVSSKSGITTQYLDYTSGSSGWVSLGRYDFDMGRVGYVQNSLNSIAKYIRTDSVKFVPVEKMLYENFESYNNSFSNINGKWGIIQKDTNSYEQSDNKVEAFAIAGNASWSNYILKSKLKITSDSGYVGIVGRYVNLDNYYHFRLNKNSNTIEFLKKVNGVWHNLYSQPFSVTSDKWFDMKIVFSDNIIKGYVDDIITFEINDSSISTGRIGYRTYLSTATFDDLLCTE